MVVQDEIHNDDVMPNDHASYVLIPLRFILLNVITASCDRKVLCSLSKRLEEDTEDIVIAVHDELLTVQLDGAATILGKENAVANGNRGSAQISVLHDAAGTDSDDFTPTNGLLALEDDAALGNLGGLGLLYDNAVEQGSELLECEVRHLGKIFGVGGVI